MSKKDISKSALEGGRYNSNKWERRNSSQKERVIARNLINTAQNDPEELEDVVIPDRRPVQKEFTDKLRPMKRWLFKQVGRKWNDVYSEVREKFDARTTAGRHILFDHLLRDVALPNDPSDVAYPTDTYFYDKFFVDDQGILQKTVKESRKTFYNRRTPEISLKHKEKIIQWLDGRKIQKVGEKLFWYIPVSINRESLVIAWGNVGTSSGYRWCYPSNSLNYLIRYVRYNDYSGNLLKEPVVELRDSYAWSLRQDLELFKEDYRFYRSQPTWVQEELVKDINRKW